MTFGAYLELTIDWAATETKAAEPAAPVVEEGKPPAEPVAEPAKTETARKCATNLSSIIRFPSRMLIMRSCCYRVHAGSGGRGGKERRTCCRPRSSRRRLIRINFQQQLSHRISALCSIVASIPWKGRRFNDGESLEIAVDRISRLFVPRAIIMAEFYFLWIPPYDARIKWNGFMCATIDGQTIPWYPCVELVYNWSIYLHFLTRMIMPLVPEHLLKYIETFQREIYRGGERLWRQSGLSLEVM